MHLAKLGLANSTAFLWQALHVRVAVQVVAGIAGQGLCVQWRRDEAAILEAAEVGLGEVDLGFVIGTEDDIAAPDILMQPPSQVHPEDGAAENLGAGKLLAQGHRRFLALGSEDVLECKEAGGWQAVEQLMRLRRLVDYRHDTEAVERAHLGRLILD